MINETWIRKLNIKLIVIYFVCLIVMALIIWINGINRNNWIEKNQTNIKEYKGEIVDCFKNTSKSKYLVAVIELSNGNQIMINTEQSLKGIVTVYNYEKNGINYYALTKIDLYNQCCKGLLFLCKMLALGPLVWYVVSLVIAIPKDHITRKNQ